MTVRGEHSQPSSLERKTIVVNGAERTYWIATPDRAAAPLLVVLHGMGLNGPRMAAWTGLALRGPQAGFVSVFPEAMDEIWDDQGCGRKDGLDDAEFVSTLVGRLVSEGTARDNSVCLAGLSNGAFFAERLARHGLVHARAVCLVAGTAREASRTAAPLAEHATAFLCFQGTADPLVPYGGGRGTGMLGWMSRRRARRFLLRPGAREAVAAQAVTSDWAATNECPADPVVESISAAPGEPAVHRLTWSAPDRLPVVLYRITGGGHGWPGGPQYMPPQLVGRMAMHLDATGLLLDFARSVVASID